MKSEANNILKDLNKAQQLAVTNTDGPIMVLAGAGSGKTRVLTYKVAYLIQQGVDPFHILALTFTNKAAREMKDRIFKLIGGEARNVWMGTFHSIFARMLRFDGHLLNYPPHFSIYDTEDSKRLIKNIVKEFNLDPKVYHHNSILSRISSCKNSLISSKDYREDTNLISEDQSTGKPHIVEIFNEYDKRLFKSAAMDFDDLLFNTYKILNNFPETLFKYQKRFQYILVDEFQDTNIAQYLIIKKLSADNENICVVGDDAQSIYGFRGADIQNILGFKKDFPNLKTYKLEQNYRSTKTIVSAANGIIKNNRKQIFKKIWTDNENGKKIKLIRATTDGEEGNLVAGSIFETKMNLHIPNDHFAILYRTNAQSRSLEEALRKLNIPYRIYGGLSFYKRKEVKDLLAYFRLVINNNDEDALLRSINFPPRGIGKTSIERLRVAADKNNQSIWETVQQIGEIKIDINYGISNKIKSFATMIKSFGVLAESKNAFDVADHITRRSGLLRKLDEDKTPEGISRTENIEELLNAIKEFCETDAFDENGEIQEEIRKLDEFMQETALLTDADEKDDDNIKKVSLMTVHAAKGLEFPYVFVTGMEENLFPSHMAIHTRDELEEERRLFYVAITRAEKQLSLSYAENRYRWGDLTFCEQSRFLDEIDENYIDFPRRTNFRMKSAQKQFKPTHTYLKKSNKQQKDAFDASFVPSDFNEIQNGMAVEHNKFGKGKVISIEGVGANRKATVFFSGFGNKQLLLKFAKLRII